MPNPHSGQALALKTGGSGECHSRSWGTWFLRWDDWGCFFIKLTTFPPLDSGSSVSSVESIQFLLPLNSFPSTSRPFQSLFLNLTLKSSSISFTMSPKVLVVLTSANEIPKIQKPTGWYLVCPIFPKLFARDGSSDLHVLLCVCVN